MGIVLVSSLGLLPQLVFSFLCVSFWVLGQWFKRKNPSYPFDAVRANWIQGAYVVYVGKVAGRRGLYRRIADLVAFGFGRAVGHRGGRLLWHLPETDKLLVRWRTCRSEEADKIETEDIACFKAVHDGRRPYANLTK